MEKKVLNIRIDATGEAGAYLHKAVQRVLIDKGFGWGACGAKDIHDYGSHPLYIEMFEDGTRKFIWQLTNSDPKATNTTVSAILSGAFNLDKWISDNSSKKKEKPVVYCVDLTWVKGEAREVISKAIQQKAFEKGYGWGFEKRKEAQFTNMSAIYINPNSTRLSYNDDFMKFNDDYVEISVNKALRGEYKSVK